MQGTAGFHARTHSWGASKTRRSYKTPRAVWVLDGLDADSIAPGAFVNDFVALLAFAFVGTVSPGPNNAVLWASGLEFGFRRTIPHIVGTALGIGVLVLGVAAGIGVLLDAVPAAELVLKLLGSAYLLYIAFLVIEGGAVGRAKVAHPFSVWHAIGFQCVNPKAWVFALAAVGTSCLPSSAGSPASRCSRASSWSSWWARPRSGRWVEQRSGGSSRTNASAAR
jgi:hypothetical protein